MAKKRKISGDSPNYVPRNKPDVADPAEEARTKAFNAGLDKLFDHFLEHGCPCRFPRFRATVSRDTRDVGVPHCTTREQQALIRIFEQRVALRDRTNDYVGYEGTCSACGAHVKQWNEEVYRDSWIAFMRITPSPGVTDAGAPLHTAVPHCGPFFSATPMDYRQNPLHMVNLQYPKVSPEDWLAWIRELRTNEPDPSP